MTEEQRHYCMSRIRSVDTRPEMVVRKFLHASGFRYSLHRKDLPGNPDIVLKKYHTVIFINGCFWHGHPLCRYATVPKTNPDFWTEKSHAAAPHVSNSLRHSSVRGSNPRQSTQSRTPSASCPTTRTKRPAQRCAEPVSSSRDAGKSLIARIFALSDSCRRVLIVFLVYEDVFLIRVDVTLLRLVDNICLLLFRLGMSPGKAGTPARTYTRLPECWRGS